jgi:hypothetical protein
MGAGRSPSVATPDSENRMSLRRLVISLTLLLGATVVAWSCGAPSPLGVAGPAGPAAFHRASDGDDGDDSDGEDQGAYEDGDSLAACRPLPYDSVTQVIGPAGGEVEVGGRAWLLVPRGALSETVRITAVAPSDTLALVRFQPDGLRFLATALLVVTYDNCRVPKSVTPRLALVTDSMNVIEFLASGESMLPHRFARKHKGHRQVAGQVHHFSNYAVAW